MMNEAVVKQGKKNRSELSLNPMYYIHIDDWMDKLGYEQFGWWLKFQTWVDRTEERFMDNHIPFTMESVYKRLGVSRMTFHRKIKPLWEYGLIDFIEFGERKSQKPINIIRYDYPFNDRTKMFEPLQKLRDYDKDYQPIGKQAGKKGALMKKMSTKKDDPFKVEQVEKSVDNHPFKVEQVDPFKSEQVTRSKLNTNNYSNKLLNVSNKSNNDSNNSSLSYNDELKFPIEVSMQKFGYTEREIKQTLNKIDSIDYDLTSIRISDIEAQLQHMEFVNVQSPAQYFINGIQQRNEDNVKESQKTKQEYERQVPFYNWLES